MANKPFGIQGADLTLGGINLQAGATGVVIPGLTQATSYRVEEVNDTDFDQTITFTETIVIDSVTYDDYVANGESVGRATYTVELDEDGYIDELEVATTGTYVGSEADRNATNDMVAYTGTASDPFDPFVGGDWSEIPFRPKMRADGVETIGGGGGLGNFNAEGTELYADNGEIIQINTFDGDGERRASIKLDSDNGFAQLYTKSNQLSNSYSTGDWATAEYVSNGGSGSINITVSPTIYNWFANNSLNYIKYSVNGGPQLNHTGWGGDSNSFGFNVDVDPGSTVTVTSLQIFWTEEAQVTVDNSEGEILIDGGTELNVNVAGWDINLTAADDLRLTGSDLVELRNSSTEESIELTTRYGTGNSKTWQFTAAGNIILPQNGDIVDQDGNSVLGGAVGGDNNIWIQTFVTDVPVADVVQGAVAVEYDDSNNIIALFSHYYTDNSGTYFSIAKFDSSGTRLWQYRYDDDFRTDGWGLAVDNNNGYIYVTGITQPETGVYSCGILSRLNTVDGSLGWTKKYDYSDSSTSAVVDVASDSNPVMVGYASNGIDTFVTVTKVSYVDGSTIWSKKLDGQYDDQAYGMAVGPSGEIVAVGWMDNLGILNTVATLSAGTNANWTVDVPTASVGGVTFGITFAAGVPTFTNIVDPTGARTQGATLGVITGDVLGGATPADDMTIIIDTVTAGDPYNKQLVVKYDSNGDVLWQKAIELDSGFDCSGADADIDSDGNIYICGNYSYSGGSAMSIVKFDSSGAKQWSRRVSGNCQDFSNSIVVGPDDCLYLTAVTGVNANSDFLMVIAKYNLDGTVAWQRLLDNTTTWTFNGSWWFEIGGGSSLAVRNGYVAVAGSFGDPGTQSLAMIAQVDSAGTLFAVDNWDYKGASFSGFLSADASDIVVYTSNKTAGTVTPTVTSISLISDNANFLVGTVYRFSGFSTGDVTFDGNKIIGTGSNDGYLGLNLAPGPGLAADMYFRVHGGDNPTHLHLSVGDNTTYDQYFGNDSKYLKLGLDGVISIGTNSNTWTFETNGNLALPGAVVNSTTAKTGSSGVPGSGQVATVTLGSTNNTNFTPGVYPGLGIGVGTGYTLTLTVAGNGDLTVEVTASGTGFFVGDQANLLGAAIAGGSSPADDIVLTVATLSNVVVATALDLTKSVNKLTTGYYTLADGAEGQVMHLVRQTGTNNATVIVANARVAGDQYTNLEHYPFTTGDINMLIFTDGAWQAMGGTWD